jgi:hypothetical protein
VSRRWFGVLGGRYGAVVVLCVGLGLTARVGYSFAVSATRGNLSFAKPQRFPNGMLLGYRLHDDPIAIADLNNDGKQDLVAGGTRVDPDRSGVSVFLNRGAADFVLLAFIELGRRPARSRSAT